MLGALSPPALGECRPRAIPVAMRRTPARRSLSMTKASGRQRQMNRSYVIIVLAGALALIDGIDLAVTLRTGRARGRSGTVTQEKQPKRFWR